MLLDDGAGHDADVQLSGKRAVGVEVLLVLGAERDEFGVVGEPVRKVVFGEYGEVAGL